MMESETLQSVEADRPLVTLTGTDLEASPVQVVERPSKMEEAKALLQAAPQTFRKLLIDNPMQMETLRFRRRFINVTQSPKLNQTLVGITLMCYGLIMALMFAIRADLHVIVVLVGQQLVAMLAAVVASHAAIAGERDRRSWDLLQVAPVTQYQIVFGKFRGVASLILAIQAGFLPLVLMSQIFGQDHQNFGITLLLEAVCAASSAFCAAFTISLSARLKNANAALVGSIASAVGLYGILPLLATVLASNSLVGPEIIAYFLAYYHPLYLLAQFVNPGHIWQPHIGLQIFAMIAGYLSCSVLILARTGQRLSRSRRSD